MKAFEPPRRDPRRDVDDEIRAHLEMRVEDLMAEGATPDEARRRAERDFGDAARVRAETLRIDERMARRANRTEWWGDLVRDVRVGLRSLRQSPAFAVTSVLCAALGIGVTAAVVSASYSILVRPLPYPNDGQLVAIYAENQKQGERGSNISYPDFVQWQAGATSFAALGMWTWNSVTLSGDGGDAERYSGGEITANLFPLLGVHPRLGRGFTQEEASPNGPRVAMISDRLWRERFGADPALVGRTIRVDGRQHTVVGVMPPGFNFPERGDVWLPFTVDPARETSHGNRYFAGAIGRIRDGVTVERATAELHAIDARMARDFPEENEHWRADVVPMREDLVGDLRQPLTVFLWAVSLVLLMVCANVANLMLARAAARGREIAVRTALGASRGRLARQLVAESLLVAGLGGVLGVGIAWLGVRLLRYAFPDDVPFFVSLSLDGTALGIVALVTVLTGILFGVVPALRATRVDPSGALRDGARGASGSLHRSRLRRALVVGEITLSVVLMVGAVLLVRSYRELAGTDLGFDEKGALTARIILGDADYPTPQAAAEFNRRLTERLRALPGVTQVGSAQGIPFSGWNVQSSARVEGMPPRGRDDPLVVHFQFVTPGFFEALGVRLVRGRAIAATDRDTASSVVVINEEMVKAGFGGADPIGRRVSLGGETPRWATVVGVVRDYRHYRLPQAMKPAVYFARATDPGWFPRNQTIVIRTAGDAASLAPALRAAVRAIDPSVAVWQVQTLEETLTRSLWRQRLQGKVLSIFAGLALVLACIGLYGVVSYAVAQRTRELGVRMALGATRRDVAWLVVGQSGRLVALGVALGLVAALFAGRIVESLLYGVQARDPMTFAMVPLVLAVVSLVAAALPARRAARVDPIVAMRAE